MTGVAVVLGRSGQLAQALAYALPRFGWATTTLGRSELNLHDQDATARTFEALKPNLVINAAAYTAVDRAEQEPDVARALNVYVAAHAASAAAAVGARYVLISTDYVFDGEKGAPYAEEDPVSPLNVYGQTKAEGEAAVLATASDAIIVRTSWLFSAYGSNFVKTMLRLAETNAEVAVVADQVGRPTAVADLANALALIALRWNEARAVSNRLFHYSNGGEASWYSFADEIMRQSRDKGGPSCAVRAIASSQRPSPARRPSDSRLDCAKITKTFGVPIRPWQDALTETLDTLRPDGD